MLVCLNEQNERFKEVLSCNFGTFENTDTVDVSHRRMHVHVVAAKT